MQKELILFSGGKDSFLTACNAIRAKHHAVLISFNPGGIVGEQNFMHGVNRLINRFGTACVSYAGIYNTSATIAKLNSNWIYLTQKELGERYPNLTNCQLNCLHCQVAMLTAAIAYARAKSIPEVSCGYKKSDVICTSNSTLFRVIQEIAYKYEITLSRPLWDLEDDDFERDLEMVRNGFTPTVLEPKCLVGRPCSVASPSEYCDIRNYFTVEMADVIPDIISKLTTVFGYIKLFIPSGEPIPGSIS